LNNFKYPHNETFVEKDNDSGIRIDILVHQYLGKGDYKISKSGNRIEFAVNVKEITRDFAEEVLGKLSKLEGITYAKDSGENHGF